MQSIHGTGLTIVICWSISGFAGGAKAAGTRYRGASEAKVGTCVLAADEEEGDTVLLSLICASSISGVAASTWTLDPSLSFASILLLLLVVVLVLVVVVEAKVVESIPRTTFARKAFKSSKSRLNWTSVTDVGLMHAHYSAVFPWGRKGKFVLKGWWKIKICVFILLCISLSIYSRFVSFTPFDQSINH